MSSSSDSPKAETDRLTEFLGFVFLEILAAPPAYDGWQALKAGTMWKATCLYTVAALPCVAGIVVLSGTWGRTRTNISRWMAGRIYPLASDVRYWMALFLVVFVYLATPILLFQLKSTLVEPTKTPEQTIAISRAPALPVASSTPQPHAMPTLRPTFGWDDLRGPMDAMAIESAFMTLPKPCRVRITIPEEHRNFRAVLARIITYNVHCEILNPEDDSFGAPPNVDVAPTPTPAPGLTIRWNPFKLDAGRVVGVFDAFGLRVAEGHTMPPDMPPDVLLIQIGPGSPWKHP
jgi:hypothetical protein